MKNRIYEFVTGIETSVQPDSGTPTDPNDIVTKSWVEALITSSSGTDFQESFAGPGTNFTLTHAPVSNASVRIYINGVFQRQGVDYTILGSAITVGVALTGAQSLDAVYRY